MYLLACLVAVIVTFAFIYLIDRMDIFKTEPKTVENVVFDTSSVPQDYVIVLVREDCPYCVELEKIIKPSNVKYTVVKLTNGMTFEFDDTFTNLSPDERDNIIKETQNVFIPGQSILFPVILTGDNAYYGFPKKDTLEKIFNV